MKKVLSAVLCLAMVFTIFADSFALADSIPNSTINYDPGSLLNLMPQPGSGTSIPEPYKALTPQFPNIPDINSPEAIAGPAIKKASPPMVENDEECPVDTVTGNLLLKNTDLSINGIGINLLIERNYSSGSTEDGPFGIGWTYNQDSILRMYSAFNIGEVRINGSTREYDFVKDDPDGYITSFDGDEMTNYQLDKGHYERAKGDLLERIGRYEYVVTTGSGEKYTYYSYQAPWREGQDKREGKLIKREDIFGNSIQYFYNNNGQPVEITDTAGRKITITWTANHITSIQDPAGQRTVYEYDSAKRLKKVTFPDGSTAKYEYDAGNRLVKTVNGAGEEETFSYNGSNQVTAVLNNVNSNIYEFSYGDGTVIKKDGMGNTWQL